MDYWCFPVIKQTKKNKQTNKKTPIQLKKRVNNERVAYIPACS